MPTQLVSVWLVPASSVRLELQDIINRLAKEQKATAFVPHLTLYGATVPGENLPEIQTHLREILQTVQPFKVESQGLGYTEEFFKTLFIKIAPNPTLSELQAKVAQLFTSYGSYGFEPHMSLLYKLITKEEKAKLAANLSVPTSFTLNEARLVLPGHNRKSWAAISDWRPLQSYPLQG